MTARLALDLLVLTGDEQAGGLGPALGRGFPGSEGSWPFAGGSLCQELSSQGGLGPRGPHVPLSSLSWELAQRWGQGILVLIGSHL